MKKLLPVSILLLTLISCGLEKEKDEGATPDDVIIRGDQAIAATRNLEAETELPIARNICNALSDQEGRVRRENRTVYYNFDRFMKACDAGEAFMANTNFSLKPIVDIDDTPTLSPVLNTFQNEVFLPSNPIIKDLCKEVSESNGNSSIHHDYEGYTVQYRFFGSNRLDLALFDKSSKYPLYFRSYVFNLAKGSPYYGEVVDQSKGRFCYEKQNIVTYYRQQMKSKNY